MRSTRTRPPAPRRPSRRCPMATHAFRRLVVAVLSLAAIDASFAAYPE
jgi:hypothetical protein